jgi:hypothetical protein
MRDDDIQPVGCAALEDRHERFTFHLALRRSAKKPRRRDAKAGHCKRRGTKKVTSCKHSYLL